MSERLLSDSAKNKTNTAKMSDGDLGTRKTLFVLVIVVGCFAVLWPKVLYPMMIGPTNQRMKPSNLDKGCCDVISDIDVNTIKIMSELCNNIIQQSDEKPLKGSEIIIRCRTEVLNKCGIDISAVLQEQVRLGRSFKQIVDEVRSFNGSLCLKYKFGLSPWRLGVAHRVTVNLAPDIRQERPAHLRPEMLHPALREKGRAIPQPYQQQPGKPSQAKFVEGRPGPVPGVRPPLGAGAGHVVHPQQKGLNSMGIIMPIYTVGIVIFFSYTLMKLLFKKKPEGPGGTTLYPPVEPSMTFRKEVFEAAKSRPPRQPGSIVNAMTALLDEVDQEMEARRKASEVASQKEPTSNGTLMGNGSAKQSQEHEQPSVKVLGMEMTASCEGGEKWSRPESPVIPNTPPPPPEPVEPPQEIYLEGALPAQSQLLVTDSTTETETSPSSSSADPAVVLASKMTLSVISLDSQESDNGVEVMERNKLRNGDLIETENETFDDDIIDESKYTTASGTTAAERDISEGERTDGEDDIGEDIEKLPELVVDNGVQQIDDDVDAELNLNDERDVYLENKPEAELNIDDDEDLLPKGVKFSEELEPVENISDVIDNILNIAKGESELRRRSSLEEDEPERKSAIKFTEDIINNDDEDKPIELMSAEDIENIGDVIDDVINIGTRMSELISAEREADSDELDDEDIIEDDDDDRVKIKFKTENLPSEKEYERAVIVDNVEDLPETNKSNIIQPTQFRTISSETESTDEDSSATVQTKPSDVNG